jgi:hypothetical protein
MNVHDFHSRFENGIAVENDVARQFEQWQWTVQRFGRGILKPIFGDALEKMRPPTLLRWLPDFLIVKLAIVAAIEVKGGEKHQKTGNWSIEAQSVSALRAFCEAYTVHGFFVFADGTCCSWQTIINFGRPRVFKGNGSGTPFLTISGNLCQPIERVFGGLVPNLGGY